MEPDNRRGIFNVWLDVKPAQGHRVLMQTYPGGIQSGMDYYLNDAGLIVAETTIAQTQFDPDGQALASRIRKALQYADSIDSAVAILSKKNNGLYTNEWLLADTKTNEIAMFELGTRKSKLWRSSKDEWFGGTEGFYWGCNNAKDLDVRLETVAVGRGKAREPRLASLRPRPRVALALQRAQGQDRRRLRLQGVHHAAAGRIAFARRQVHDLGAGQGAEDLGLVRPAAGPDLGADRVRAELPGNQAAGRQRLDDLTAERPARPD